MTALRDYLGHSSILLTYWYLEATPVLMRTIAAANEDRFAGGGQWPRSLPISPPISWIICHGIAARAPTRSPPTPTVSRYWCGSLLSIDDVDRKSTRLNSSH